MINYRFAIALLMCAAAPSAFGQTVVAQPNVTAADIVSKPLSDLNIKKTEVPPILLAAREQPYDLAGLRSCRSIQNAVGELNAALGDDMDVAAEKTRDEKRGNAVGSVARSVMTSLIPFNGVIREISGANANDRQWQVALYAGASRRAFLKGYGQAKGCPYPARAATARDVAAVAGMRSTETGSKPETNPKHQAKHKTRRHRA